MDIVSMQHYFKLIIIISTYLYLKKLKIIFLDVAKVVGINNLITFTLYKNSDYKQGIII